MHLNKYKFDYLAKYAFWRLSISLLSWICIFCAPIWVY